MLPHNVLWRWMPLGATLENPELPSVSVQTANNDMSQ